MDTAAIITLFFGIVALAAKFGPGNMTVVSKAISEGIVSVIYFMVGTNLVKIGFFGVVVAGFAFAGDDLMFFSILVKALAGAYLIWLGIKGLRKFDVDMPMMPSDQARTGFWENFSAGFLMTLSNPFDILFFAGILPTILDVSTIGFSDFLIGAAVIVVADTLVTMSYALPLSMTRKFFTPTTIRYVNTAASIAIILVGLIIGFSALPANDLLSVLG